MTRKVMKLLNPSTGLMECRVCGSTHFANIRRGGHYFRGSWQCQHGCKLPQRIVIHEKEEMVRPAHTVTYRPLK